MNIESETNSFMESSLQPTSEGGSSPKNSFSYPIEEHLSTSSASDLNESDNPDASNRSSCEVSDANTKTKLRRAVDSFKDIFKGHGQRDKERAMTYEDNIRPTQDITDRGVRTRHRSDGSLPSETPFDINVHMDLRLPRNRKKRVSPTPVHVPLVEVDLIDDADDVFSASDDTSKYKENFDKKLEASALMDVITKPERPPSGSRDEKRWSGKSSGGHSTSTGRSTSCTSDSSEGISNETGESSYTSDSSESKGTITHSSLAMLLDSDSTQSRKDVQTGGADDPDMSDRKSAVKSPSLGARKRLKERHKTDQSWTCLEAQFAFNYTNEQGRQIDIRRGDRYLLLSRTNEEWWHVLPHDIPDLAANDPSEVEEEVIFQHSFYIPAKYVMEVKMPVMSEPERIPGGSPDVRGHRRQGSTGTDSSATPDWKDDSGASNDGLEPSSFHPTPTPKPRKICSLDIGPGTTAEFRANLEGKISSLPRTDFGLYQENRGRQGSGDSAFATIHEMEVMRDEEEMVRPVKSISLPFGERGIPPSPPSSSTKPVLLPTLPSNIQLRPTHHSDSSQTPCDDPVIYANINDIGVSPPPPIPTNRLSTMRDVVGFKSITPTGGPSENTTPSDRPTISGPIPLEGGACLQNAQKRGMVTKTKVEENGKKLKKNWTQHLLVLSGGSLFFYKDMKAATPKSGHPHGRPDLTLELETVKVEEVVQGETKRKHVLRVVDRGAPGSSVAYLLQLADATRCQEWKVALNFAKELAARKGYQTGAENIAVGSIAAFNSPKRHRSSFRKKNESSSSSGAAVTPTGASTASVERSTVMQMLKELFRVRHSPGELEAKGIIKNEPVFGSTLKLLVEQEKTDGEPIFVSRCINAIEKRDGLTVQGVYRVNGNGATIQKLRCLVDQTNNYDLMESQWDLEVLTGALKLFFRELKEPLIPCASYQKFVDVISIKDKGRMSAMKELIKKLPSCHHETMKVLFQHLHRVVLNSKANQMHPRNIAIVFGPNLLWPSPSKQGSGSNSEGLTASVMAQNQIVEFILNGSEEFFPSPPPLPQRAVS